MNHKQVRLFVLLLLCLPRVSNAGPLDLDRPNFRDRFPLNPGDVEVPADGPPVRSATPAQCKRARSIAMKRMAFLPGRSMTLWYPTSGVQKPVVVASNLKSVLVNDGTMLGCALPLVVFSHGIRGCSTQSLFIVETLARAGYVVAAPDHLDAGCVNGSPVEPPGVGDSVDPDPAFRNPEEWNSQTFVDRRDDIEAVIDLLSAQRYARFVNPDQISVVGHSLGGYTALGVSGAWADWLDPRIKAAVLLSPISQPFLNHATLGGLQVPTMYQGGTLDFAITPVVRREGGTYDSSPRPKYYLEFERAGHLAWTNLVCRGATTVARCVAKSKNAQLIIAYTKGFLDEYSRGKASRVLQRKHRSLADYRVKLD